MFFSWDEQSIKWFLDAAAFTGFHKALALRIVPYLEPGDTVIDVGCGLGRLDIELCAYVSEITAIDINEHVTQTLLQDIERLKLKNLRVLKGDVYDSDETFDVMLMSLYGSPDNSVLFKRFRRRLIRIVSAGTKSHLYPESHRVNKKESVAQVQDEFESLGVSYKLDLCSIEFGQPLISLQDAGAFVLKNAPNAKADEVEGFLSENITETGREDFPYYLPYQKQLGIFIIDRVDISDC